MTNPHNLIPVTVSSLSTTYVKCRISATENGVASDPTTGTVDFAFLSEADEQTDPESGDWSTGLWETASDGYWGKCLVGPSGVATLAKGSYDVWVRVTKTPEEVIDRVGVLNIY